MSDEESEKELLSKNIVGIIFLLFVTFVGSFGNFNTILVYATRYKPSNHRIFIIFLGVTDLTSCFLIVPFDIYRLLNESSFNDIVCDFINVNRFLSIASLSLLSALAYERFRKLCRPLKWQMRKRHSIYCSFGILLITFVLFYIPCPFMYGVVPHEFNMSRLHGNVSVCSIMPGFKDSPLDTTYNILLMVLGAVNLTVCVVSYVFLLRLFWKKGPHLHFLKKSKGSCNSSGSGNTTETTADSGSDSDTGHGSGSGGTTHGTSGSGSATKVAMMHTNMPSDRYRRARRLTFVLLVATIISYSCAFVTLLFSLFNEDENLHFDVVDTFKSGYEVFYNFNYVNHVVNPIVYCFMDNVFRNRLKGIYMSAVHKICC